MLSQIAHMQTRTTSPMTRAHRARLLAFLQPGVVNQSSHLLRTGRPRNYYIDFDQILTVPAECERVVQWYSDTILSILHDDPMDIGILAVLEKGSESGGTVGAVQIAGAVSIASRRPFVVVRLGKELPSERIKFSSRGEAVSVHERFKGASFAVLTDHCTGGDEAKRAIEVIRDNGGHVRHLLSYSIILPEFDREWFDREGIEVHKFLTAPDDLLLLDSEFHAFHFSITDEAVVA